MKTELLNRFGKALLICSVFASMPAILEAQSPSVAPAKPAAPKNPDAQVAKQIAGLEAALGNPKQLGKVLAETERLKPVVRDNPGLNQRLLLLHARALLKRNQPQDIAPALAELRAAGDLDRAKAPDAAIASQALLILADRLLADPTTWPASMQAATEALNRASQALQGEPKPNANTAVSLSHLASRARRAQALVHVLQERSPEAIRLLEQVQVENASYFRSVGGRARPKDREESEQTDRLCRILKMQDESGFPPWTGTPPAPTMRDKKKLADLFFALGDWPRAIPRYAALQEEARSRGGNTDQLFAWCLIQRARCLAGTENPEAQKQALEIYEGFFTQESLRQSPVAPGALLRAGVLCVGPFGDIARGRQLFKAAVDRYPNTREGEMAEYYLAVLDLEARNWAAAENAFEAFLKKRPKSGLCAYIQETLLPRAQAKGKPAEKVAPST